MPNGSNFIFDKLVEGEHDFIGMVAYTLYKQQKIEWLRDFEEKNGNKASNNDLESFIHVSNLDSQLRMYREQATELIDTFLDLALESEYSEMTDALQKEKENIRNDAIVKAVNRTWWRSVFENALGGVLASFILFGSIGIVWVAFQGPERLIKQTIQNYINDKPTLLQEKADTSSLSGN